MKNDSQKVFRSVLVAALFAMSGFTAGVHADSANSTDNVTQVALETFQVPELVPNTALDEIKKVKGSSGTLARGEDALHALISTLELPEAVYTFWWHLTHPDGEVSILWAGSQIVSSDGKLVLSTVLPEGEENAPGDIFIGHGLQPGNAALVTVELWVRSHGPLSDDPEIGSEQQTKPFGGCTDSRNPHPRPDTDYPCWNPQRAVF